MIEAAIFVVFPFCLAIAACTDAMTMTIPNRVSIVLIGAFAVIAPLAGFGLTQFALHAAAALAVFGVGFCLFALGVMGGGDAKLLTACALWFGPTASLADFLMFVSVAGGILTIAVLLVRTQAHAILASRIPFPQMLLTATKIPYGIAIAVGGFAAYPSSPLMKSAFSLLS